MNKWTRHAAWLIAVIGLCLNNSICFGGALVIDHRHTDITRLTSNQIQRAKDTLHIAYGHTSHGSQLTDGMSGLVGFANGGGKGLSFPTDFFAWNNGGSGGALDLHDYAMGGDVGYYPDWVANTTNYLNNSANSNVNVIIWSWCGQMDDKYSAGTLSNEYLLPMAALEAQYPQVTFVYMTGHTEIWDDADNKAACEVIRNFCSANGKVLYDFNDIEHYDPNGVYYEYVTDSCAVYTQAGGTAIGNWATSWQESHVQNVDWYSCSSAHSEPLNANLKAYAAWALWCALLEDDADGDGLSDAWEEQYGGTGLFAGGTHDADGDGMTDLDEYMANSVPTNALSVFVITDASASSSNSLSFLSSSSRVYSLAACGDLCAGDWSVVNGVSNRPGTGGMMTLSDTNSAGQRFYRIGVGLPE